MTTTIVTAGTKTGTSRLALIALVAAVGVLLTVPLPDAATACGWTGVAAAGLSTVLGWLRMRRLAHELLCLALGLGLATSALTVAL